MKSLQRICSKVFSEPWLILPDKHRSIQRALLSHMARGARADAIDGDGPDIDDDEPEQEGPYLRVGNGVGVIKVSGILGKRLDWFESMCGGYDVDTLTAALEMAVDDPSIAKILIDWDSPGGVVTGIPEAGDAIREASAKKPVVSFCEMCCCSGAVWLATQARRFYATRSSDLGSIGVYALFLDESAALEMEGLQVNAISAGEYKLAGASFKAMTKGERALLQEKVNRIHIEFKASVKSKRPDMPDEMMEGQVFDGKYAADIGLCDGIVSGIDEMLSLM